jgi:flagellar basal-body rod modification protein FlgD
MSVIGNISSLTGSAATTTATSTSTNAEDKDMFLKLLVAQMKYQDPSNPTDSTQYLQQMAQFSMVEKLDALAKAQTKSTASSQLQSAVGMIGTIVEYGAGDAAGAGTVTSVTVVGGVPKLIIGDKTIELADVTKVTAAS